MSRSLKYVACSLLMEKCCGRMNQPRKKDTMRLKWVHSRFFFSMIVVKMVARAHEELTEWVGEGKQYSDGVCRKKKKTFSWLASRRWMVKYKRCIDSQCVKFPSFTHILMPIQQHRELHIYVCTALFHLSSRLNCELYRFIHSKTSKRRVSLKFSSIHPWKKKSFLAFYSIIAKLYWSE